ncbi:MAG: hypothetical protein PHE84_12785 [bacterium]|nr:hypothetical protein [bacterium]
MKNKILAITFLLTTALAAGSAAAEGKAAAQLNQAKTETKEAAQAVRDYAYAQKAEFVAEMKKDLAGIQDEMNRLSAKISKSSGKSQTEAKTKLKALRKKWAQTKKQLDRAESATESTWNDVKGGFQKSYGELKDSFEQTRQWLSEKIEP